MTPQKSSITDGIIGGVFPAQDFVQDSSNSLLDGWIGLSLHHHWFHNARSAIRWVVEQQKPSNVWLPAYLCPSIHDALYAVSSDIQFYDVDHELHITPDLLNGEFRKGDAVLTINYFGRPTSSGMRARLANDDDILWIEDCAQTLGFGSDHYGDVRVYSPRKVLGVPDGGLMIDVHGRFDEPNLQPCPTRHLTSPGALRRLDPEGNDRSRWFKAFQDAEAAMTSEPCEADPVTRRTVASATYESICSPRTRNYNFLADNLPDLALFPGPASDWVPFGFPIVTSNHDTVRNALYDNLIFAPKLWSGMPSPPSAFPEAHSLSERLLMIPCDQRYTLHDMERVVSVLRNVNPQKRA